MYVREKTAVLSQQGRVWQSADRLRKQIINPSRSELPRKPTFISHNKSEIYKETIQSVCGSGNDFRFQYLVVALSQWALANPEAFSSLQVQN